MPGYMSGSKRARSTPSIANNTKIFGDMAGNSSSLVGRPYYLSNYIRTRTLSKDPTSGMKPVDAKNYLINNNLLSKNPTSGGVGRRAPFYTRSGLRW